MTGEAGIIDGAHEDALPAQHWIAPSTVGRGERHLISAPYHSGNGSNKQNNGAQTQFMSVGVPSSRPGRDKVQPG